MPLTVKRCIYFGTGNHAVFPYEVSIFSHGVLPGGDDLVPQGNLSESQTAGGTSPGGQSRKSLDTQLVSTRRFETVSIKHMVIDT